MIDKELIKQEIERRIKNLEFSLERNCVEKHSKLDILGNITTLESLLQFIDSIPEEPASEDLEEEIQRAYYDKSLYDADNLDRQDFNNIAHHFAEWQKQQIMKDAVDGQVVYQIGSAEIAPTDIRYKVVSDRVYIPNIKLGDKVKIIVIKED